MQNSKTIAFLTLGCKVNYYETEKMLVQFKEAGYHAVDFSDVADVYVVNTCTVTNIADRKSRKMLHRARKLNPAAIVVATGCYAQAEKEKLSEDERIDLVVDNEEKERIVQIVQQYEKTHPMEERARIYEQNDSDGEETTTHEPEERTRAYLKIQQGCNQFCSYCMIPYVRGKLTSKSEEVVVDEVEKLVAMGYREVVLTGIHLSSYGVDFDTSLVDEVRKDASYFVKLEGRPLLSVLRRLNKIPGLDRIRLGSLEPRIITERFVQELSSLSKVCPHFHLSLQSGCDATLQRMNRKYTTEEYLNGCAILRRFYDRPALTTDVIVGFPGETDEEFKKTLHFVRQAGFAQIHVFKYSRRKGTKADAMKEQVAEEKKNTRSNELLAVEAELERQYAESFLGEETQVLVEEIHRDSDGSLYETGHNERYLRFMIPIEEGKAARENQMITVQMESVRSDLAVLTRANDKRVDIL